MDPIISPWFFYLLSIVGTIKTLCSFLGWMSFIFLLASLIGYFVVKENQSCDYSDSDEKPFDPFWLLVWKKLRKFFCVMTFIFLPLSIFIPNKNTLIWMVVAKNVTYDNVGKAIEAGGDFKNELKKDMLEIIETIKGEETKEKQ